MDIDESRVIAVGAAAWMVALIATLAFYDDLADRDREWWIWTCVTGLGLGCWGWYLVRKRIRARRGGVTLGPTD